LTRAIELGSEDAYCLAARGAAYLRLEAYDHAIADLSRAIERDPGCVHCLTERAMAYAETGTPARALLDVDRAVALEPDNADALVGRCWIRVFVGPAAQALDDCDRAMKLRPGSPQILDVRGIAYLKLENPSAAARDFGAALKPSPVGRSRCTVVASRDCGWERSRRGFSTSPRRSWSIRRWPQISSARGCRDERTGLVRPSVSGRERS